MAVTSTQQRQTICCGHHSNCRPTDHAAEPLSPQRSEPQAQAGPAEPPAGAAPAARPGRHAASGRRSGAGTRASGWPVPPRRLGRGTELGMRRVRLGEAGRGRGRGRVRSEAAGEPELRLPFEIGAVAVSRCTVSRPPTPYSLKPGPRLGAAVRPARARGTGPGPRRAHGRPDAETLAGNATTRSSIAGSAVTRT